MIIITIILNLSYAGRSNHDLNLHIVSCVSKAVKKPKIDHTGCFTTDAVLTC